VVCCVGVFCFAKGEGGCFAELMDCGFAERQVGVAGGGARRVVMQV